MKKKKKKKEAKKLFEKERNFMEQRKKGFEMLTLII